jgi:hypothetical protein
MAMTAVMKVETKMIASIADSPIERAEIFVIMYVETIKNGSHETSTIGHLTRALLVVLQIIHVIWTTHILKSAATKFTMGKVSYY